MSARTSRAGRRALGLITVAGLLTAGSVGPTTAATAARVDLAASAPQASVGKGPKADELHGSERAELARAVAEGAPTVTVMVVARPGEVAQARNEVRRLGGSIRYAADELGYFSAVVPTGEVEQTAALQAVEAVDLDEVVPLPEVDAEAGTGAAATSGGPGAATPDDNAFMPTRETGSIAFKRANPTWDGRGIRIGVLDSGIDLAHPALQTTSTGERKIVDSFTATDPVTEGSLVPGGDATWLPMVTDARGPSSTYDDETWTLPAGTFKIQAFSEADVGGEVLGDVNRDGDTSDRFGVLLDQRTNQVRVDSNGNRDFTDDEPMRPYGKAFEQGVFGEDGTSTGEDDVVTAMPFAIDVREDLSLAPIGLPGTYDFVDIGLVSGAHGSHVAGIAAANDMFGGRMDGQAPGAELVSARACGFGTGCTAAALTDGMAELAAHRGVDLINMSIGSLPALNDGANARAALYNRIIGKGVQLVISAGNSGNALNTIGDPSVATDVMSVGASISRQTWKANYGSDVPFAHGMLTFSSGGPREDGGFKPDVTAPGSAISTTPTWQPGGPVAEGGYSLPAGYSTFNGTSMASPQAAGALALMLSAAEQEGVKATSPAALRSAVYSTAQHDPTIPAFLQGHGQIDVVAAYALLERGPAPDAFTVRAPVCTEVWKALGLEVGIGVHDRCEAEAGVAKRYPVTITRTTGSSSGTYAVSLVGNDGTFSVSPSSVRLPKGKPVTVTVTAAPRSGASTAVLRLDDSRTLGVDTSVMLAVVTGTDLGAAPYEATASGTSERNVSKRHYVTVKPGTKALQLELTGLAEGTQTRFLAFHPYGLPMDATASTACYSNRSTDAACNSAERVYADPQPGIWEVLVETRRTSPVASTPYTLTSRALGVTVTPAEAVATTSSSRSPTAGQAR